MAIDWALLEREYDEVLEKLSDPKLAREPRVELQKRSSQLDGLLSRYRELLALNSEITELKAGVEDCAKSADSCSAEMRLLYQEELAGAEKRHAEVAQQIQDLVAPPDERDSRPAFLEIRAGAGGQEASLFVADLCRMYTLYAQHHGWHCSVDSASTTEVGGYRELVLYVSGKNVFSHFKYEAGVHRVQRVPKTETAGRIHTSTVTVAVMPEVEEVDLEIKPSDLRIDTYRSSGAGGQHVNTTDSAVRITHIPTGVVVACQAERSQIKNRAMAMKMLRARLYEAERERVERERSTVRKQQVGTGERSEKIRTYNFPQNRITDHRINLTLKKLDMVMEGDLDDVIEPLRQAEREERISKANV